MMRSERPGLRSRLAALVAAPASGDHLIEEDGARVFLARDAAGLLEEKTLDAAFHGEGGVAFTITDTE